jgi:ankyrin repeat protein
LGTTHIYRRSRADELPQDFNLADKQGNIALHFAGQQSHTDALICRCPDCGPVMIGRGDRI